MSSSGTYNFHPKVANPNKQFIQMTSGGDQAPFYFGGSQVPINLGIRTGSGFRKEYRSHTDHMKCLTTQGRGLQTTVQKVHNIYLPKHLSSIKKII